MSRLPQPGADDGRWGEILNDYLSQVHDSVGALKPASVTTDAIAERAIISDKIASDGVSSRNVSATRANDGDVLIYDSNVPNGMSWAGLPSGGEANTASNTGATGVGVFDQKNDVDLEFKKINAASSKVVVTDNTSNGTVDIDVNTASLGLTKSSVGLANVDNTSDTAKPVSTATQTALDSKLSASSTYASVGAGEGFNYSLNLNYDTNNPSLAEPFMVKVQNGAGNLQKSFWLNESGLPRTWTSRKNEPSLKLHGFGANDASPILAVCDAWNQSATRRWGVNGRGQQLLGPDQVTAGAVVVLGASDPLPTGLPNGTLIVRTA